MTPNLLPRRAQLAITTAIVAFSASVATAENRPTLNFYGVSGLMDMPSGESQPDGAFTASTAHFGSVSRNTITFQITPRLSGSFRYQAVRNFNDVVPSSFDTYYDRNFDLRYQIAIEGQYMPAIVLGAQDFVGTGLFSAEYIVATKNLTPQLKVTGGLGWGRLGSYGGIGAPFGDRPDVDVDEGGKINGGQWFRGPAAPFAGVEYKFGGNWSVKAEYSSDNYNIESDTRETFDKKSPFNFGVEYTIKDSVQLGAYYLYGSEVGLAAHFYLNPKQRPSGSIRGGAPDPVEPRPSQAADPDAWSSEWVTQSGVAPILITNINKRLEKDGIVVEGIAYTGSTAQVLMRNDTIDSEAQSVGRLARAMTHVMPASVEVFEIVPVVNGLRAAMVTVRRSDMEKLEFTPGADELMRERAVLADPGPVPANLTYGTDLAPRFSWGLSPFLRTRLFDPTNPIRAEIGLRLSALYQITPGLSLQGAITKRVVGNLGEGRGSNSELPRVRSEGVLYDREGDPALESLTLAYYKQFAPTLYGRVTVGYLERMFGGISTEVLWKQVNNPLAVGLEVNYAVQREYAQGLGFRDYDVVTGHLSGYYTFGKEKDFLAQLDVGRYLAGDYGATLTLDRQFPNGWIFGVFATLTDVPFEKYGEGSFDKGIKLEIPANWFLGQPSRDAKESIVRPLSRDGGARLDVDGRLFDNLRDYQESEINAQWGRFWK
jgi:hypothetical protein